MNGQKMIETIERVESEELMVIEIRECGPAYQVLEDGLLLATYDDVSAAMLHALLAGDVVAKSVRRSTDPAPHHDGERSSFRRLP